MQRPLLFPTFFWIGILLAACGSPVQGSQEDYRMPTNVSSAASRTETPVAETAASIPPADCPVTAPQNPAFLPPVPYDKLGSDGYFWFGSDPLWTAVPKNGVWSSLPENPEGYTQKIFWWRDGYGWTEEPQPNLVVTAERLDANVPPVRAARATNAYAADIGSAMLTGMDFPTRGCWKITGKYKENMELSFVVWIAP